MFPKAEVFTGNLTHVIYDLHVRYSFQIWIENLVRLLLSFFTVNKACTQPEPVWLPQQPWRDRMRQFPCFTDCVQHQPPGLGCFDNGQGWNKLVISWRRSKVFLWVFIIGSSLKPYSQLLKHRWSSEKGLHSSRAPSTLGQNIQGLSWGKGATARVTALSHFPGLFWAPPASAPFLPATPPRARTEMACLGQASSGH